MFTHIKGKPHIKYPCRWVYKLFGMDQSRIREAVARAVAGHDHSLDLSRSSRHRKYHCMNLVVLVKDEKNRDDVFYALQREKDIILIL